MDQGQNVALFCDAKDETFVQDALAPWTKAGGVFLMTTDAALLPSFSQDTRLPFAGSWPDSPEVGSDRISTDIIAIAETHSGLQTIVVDMTWALNVVWAATLVERWGTIAQSLADEEGLMLISLYNRELLVEDQFAAALRAHQFIAAPSGVHSNPHWLPRDLIANATHQDQLNFLLGRVVPEFRGTRFHRTEVPDLARGATPVWARGRRDAIAARSSSARWHIHCLGPLRVFVNGHEPVNWAVPGSAPKKSRALFAYLLNRGDTGAHTDQLGEFLWPEDGTETAKRGRLRHTIAMLRKSLGSPDSVVREGELYRLNIPAGSWIDIRAFEQLCRRGLAQFRHGEHEGATRLYIAAEKLYGGDLFEDLPIKYAQSEFEDWCIPKRVWLHDMAVKLQNDLARVLRHQGRLREALEHAMKALHMQPLNDAANIEVMRTLAAQERPEAITRQYQQYLKAIVNEGDAEPSDEVHDVYRELVPKTAA